MRALRSRKIQGSDKTEENNSKIIKLKKIMTNRTKNKSDRRNLSFSDKSTDSVNSELLGNEVSINSGHQHKKVVKKNKLTTDTSTIFVMSPAVKPRSGKSTKGETFFPQLKLTRLEMTKNTVDKLTNSKEISKISKKRKSPKSKHNSFNENIKKSPASSVLLKRTTRKTFVPEIGSPMFTSTAIKPTRSQLKKYMKNNNIDNNSAHSSTKTNKNSMRNYVNQQTSNSHIFDENYKDKSKLSDISDSILLENEVINISDSSNKTLNSKSKSFGENMSNTVINDNTFNNLEETPKEQLSDTYELPNILHTNNSGNWQEENLVSNSVFYISDENNTIESKSNNLKVENKSFHDQHQLTGIFELPAVVNTNNSGDWQVENLLTKSITNDNILESEIHNETFTCIVENNKENKNVTFKNETAGKSARKKWQRFARNSQGAQSILEQIKTPEKKITTNMKLFNVSQKFNNSVNSALKKQSTPNQTFYASQSLNKTVKSASKTQSTKKNDTIKKTVMPNFALIHKKAFEKMESLTDYSNRKSERAKMLLSSNKKLSSMNKVDTKIDKQKKKSARQLYLSKEISSRQLFPSKDVIIPTKTNRFGFSLKNIVPVETVNSIKNLQTNRPIPQKSNRPVAVKSSVFARDEILAVANKKKVPDLTKTRENRKEILKGVRTNRRFDLLMQMRNK